MIWLLGQDEQLGEVYEELDEPYQQEVAQSSQQQEEVLFAVAFAVVAVAFAVRQPCSVVRLLDCSSAVVAA